MTVWKDLPGFEGAYEVSDDGRVRSLARTIKRSFADGRSYTCKWPSRDLVLFSDGHGYRCVKGCGRGKKRNIWVHRAVCWAFNGAPPKGKPVVRHRDGNILNNTPQNLVWGTMAENSHDMIEHGTAMFGERNPVAKLQNHEVLEIRERAAVGESLVGIAADYGVSRSAIQSIKDRTTWPHLKTQSRLG